mgnify:CR=1 FL=1|jgi:hypothetical protein
MGKVFTCDDLRREIFSYLRKHPQRKCIKCNKVLIWDKKVNEYVVIQDEYKYFFTSSLPEIKSGYYCIMCYTTNFQLVCTIY